MMTEKDLEDLYEMGKETAVKYIGEGIRGAVSFLKGSRELIHGVVKDVKAVVDFIDERLEP